ncbi:MAG: hypothetical protein HQL55_12735 [Magnetococcales bacterium]|nr:hypothetical protein [Magnetococcales bacterium]
MFYRCYDLLIQSELALPELVMELQSCQPKADVKICFGTTPQQGLPHGQQMGPFSWVGQDEFWLQVKGVARYWVRSSQHIIIDPEPTADEHSLRVFLLGTIFGVLLFQRGFLVLHGNAVRVGSACLICAGDSGAGKSTLAAALWQRGYDILADDVVPINKQCQALLGFPRIKLWQDAAEKLAIPTDNLHPIRPGLKKFHFPLPAATQINPVPVRWVYILSQHNQSDITIKPISGMKRYKPLMDHTYRRRFMKGMALAPHHLQLCGQLAAQIRLVEVNRPKQGFSLDHLVETILADVENHP